MSIEFSDLKQC